MDFVLCEISATALVDVNATRLALEDLTLHDRRIGASLHFKPGDAVIIDLVAVEVALDFGKSTS